MELRSREPVDLYAVAALTVAFVAVLAAAPGSALRVPLGLLVVLYFPGHALVASLFPGRALGVIERAAPYRSIHLWIRASETPP